MNNNNGRWGIAGLYGTKSYNIIFLAIIRAVDAETYINNNNNK